jgi:hypothetical protein
VNWTIFNNSNTLLVSAEASRAFSIQAAAFSISAGIQAFSRVGSRGSRPVGSKAGDQGTRQRLRGSSRQQRCRPAAARPGRRLPGPAAEQRGAAEQRSARRPAELCARLGVGVGVELCARLAAGRGAGAEGGREQRAADCSEDGACGASRRADDARCWWPNLYLGRPKVLPRQYWAILGPPPLPLGLFAQI